MTEKEKQMSKELAAYKMAVKSLEAKLDYYKHTGGKQEPSVVHVQTNIFDQEEIHENCTVQVLTNSMTGEVSVGWWENE